MENQEKRPHITMGNTPHKPKEKRACEIEREHVEIEKRPAQRNLAFQGRGSPLQKVCGVENPHYSF